MTTSSSYGRSHTHLRVEFVLLIGHFTMTTSSN
jgi:hypothetical protein